MKNTLLCFFFAALASPLGFAADDAPVLETTTQGTPSIGRIDVISFAPGGVLLIGDGQNRQIVAVDLKEPAAAETKLPELQGLRARIAQRLGTDTEGVELLDLAVNPVSHLPILALRKQDDKVYLLVRVRTDGSIEHVSLEDVTHACIPLPQGDKAPVSRITDVVWAGDRLLAAARCNEEFASKIFAAEGPVSHNKAGQLYSAETYHVSHRKWETRAPMSVMIPYEEDGKHYIVGAFSCTPVVKYPVDAVEPGAKIKGSSMIELGSGNRPLDMFAYERDGKSSVLTNTFRFHHEKRPYGPSPHLAFRFDQNLLSSQQPVNENATRRLKGADPATDQIEIAETFHGVIQMDRVNDQQALALKERADGDVDLVAIRLP